VVLVALSLLAGAATACGGTVVFEEPDGDGADDDGAGGGEASSAANGGLGEDPTLDEACTAFCGAYGVRCETYLADCAQDCRLVGTFCTDAWIDVVVCLSGTSAACDDLTACEAELLTWNSCLGG